MSINEKQLTDILSEVQKELDTMMKSELETLAKARPGEETTGEGQEDSSKTDPTGENTSAASESPDAASASPDASGSDSSPPAADASASASPAGDGSAPPADASASPDGSAPADPAAQAGPIDPMQLMAEYAQLPPEDLKAHYLACKEALVQVLGAAGADDGSAPPAPGADASAAAPPPPPPAAASAPAAGSPPPGGPTLKSEVPSGDKLKSPGPAIGENPLHKTEAEFQAAIDAKVEETVAPLIKVVKMIVETPLRKSIAFAADLPASKDVDVSKMSRETIRAKLSEKIKTGTLTKSEQDLVIDFDTGRVKADAVAHLLK